MLDNQAIERARHYLRFLDDCKYEAVESLVLEATESDQSWRRVPEELSWVRIALPYAYGREWSCHWFRTSFIVPDQSEGRELFLGAETGADTLVFLDREPAGALNRFHTKLRLFDRARGGDSGTVALECYAGHRYPGRGPLEETRIIVTLDTEIDEYPIWFRSAALYCKRLAVYDLYYDASVILECALNLNEHSLRRNRIIAELNHALLAVHFTADGKELESQAQEARERIAPLLATPNQTAPTVYAIGHAHIDHAWLWPIEETRRKIARTFANMARYAREYPEFRFIQSMPAQLEQLREDYPTIFEAVRECYEAGQWEPNGGMYVEADTNMPSAESLIRQFLVGKAMSRKLLGYEGETLWLPDDFGFPATLPQIMRGCEMSYFVTSKMSWNDTTRFPYDTFRWIGNDGSHTRATFISGDGYNGTITPGECVRSWQWVQHKELQDAIIKPVGQGDGGGGTRRGDLERARRMRDLEGTPRVEWSTAANALEVLFDRADSLPEWQGELYLEQHRGTFTTQAAIKRGNRECELLLRDTELVWALVSRFVPSLDYPREALTDSWKKLLLHQFHDILPGSSIERVNREARESYSALAQRLRALREDGIRRLAGSLGLSGKTLVMNTLPWHRTVTVELPADGPTDDPADGEKLDSVRVDLPACGLAAAVEARDGRDFAESSPFSYDGTYLTTKYYRVRFDGEGAIASLRTTESEVELVAGGAALNTFLLAEDVPRQYDAWNIDSDYRSKPLPPPKLEATAAVEKGPHIFRLRQCYAVGSRSEIVQDVVLYAFNRRIDFETKVEWNEDHAILKALFPTDLYTSTVRCDIGAGWIDRPSHRNTPHDRAKYEFCAHKYVAASDGARTVAVLNNCKYGHHADGAMLGITLLRSPSAPDETADRGTHEFTYSFCAYDSGFIGAGVIRDAYELNVPPTAVAAGGDGTAAGTSESGSAVRTQARSLNSQSLFEIDEPGIVLEAVKAAESGEGIVVRLIESLGIARHITLRTAFPIVSAHKTNMLERDSQELVCGERSVVVETGAFEIITLVLS